jgi:hypothetical protein
MRYDAPRVRTSQPDRAADVREAAKDAEGGRAPTETLRRLRPGAGGVKSRAMLATFGALAPVFLS